MTLQKDIIQRLGVKKTIIPQEEIRKSVDFLKEYIYKHSFFKSFILGISGGQDSTLAGKLAQQASDELQKEGYDFSFIALRLPYGIQKDETDAKNALAFIKPDKTFVLNIQPAVDEMIKTCEKSGITISDFNKGNIKARQRMMTQYAVAGTYQGVVLGTDHAAESVTGFYTKFGDGASDLMPLFRLNKRQGRQMLVALQADPSLYEKIPTADLEDEKPLLSDEQALGVTYDQIDDYLEGKTIDKKAQQKIEHLYQQTQHKRHLPITLFDTFWK